MSSSGRRHSLNKRPSTHVTHKFFALLAALVCMMMGGYYYGCDLKKKRARVDRVVGVCMVYAVCMLYGAHGWSGRVRGGRCTDCNICQNDREARF